MPVVMKLWQWSGVPREGSRSRSPIHLLQGNNDGKLIKKM
jgi:hypothetical protein